MIDSIPCASIQAVLFLYSHIKVLRYHIPWGYYEVNEGHSYVS